MRISFLLISCWLALIRPTNNAFDFIMIYIVPVIVLCHIKAAIQYTEIIVIYSYNPDHHYV